MRLILIVVAALIASAPLKAEEYKIDGTARWLAETCVDGKTSNVSKAVCLAFIRGVGKGATRVLAGLPKEFSYCPTKDRSVAEVGLEIAEGLKAAPPEMLDMQAEDAILVIIGARYPCK